MSGLAQCPGAGFDTVCSSSYYTAAYFAGHRRDGRVLADSGSLDKNTKVKLTL
jgi:hypothetical protein